MFVMPLPFALAGVFYGWLIFRLVDSIENNYGTRPAKFALLVSIAIGIAILFFAWPYFEQWMDNGVAQLN